MWQFIATSFLTVFLVWLWKVYSFFWLEPRRWEKVLRQQGFDGNPYKAPFGDTKAIKEVAADAYSRPLGLHDDICPRAMPFVHKTITKYGKNSFAWIGPRPRLYITDPETMREVLTRHTSFQKNFRVTNKVYKLLVGGFIEFEEERWARHRTKLNPGFHLDRLKNMSSIFVAMADNILSDWKSRVNKGSSSVVDVFSSIKYFSSSSVTNALYGRPFDKDMEKCFFGLLNLSYMANISVKTFDIPGKGLLPTPLHMKAAKLEKEIRGIFRDMIVTRVKKRRVEGMKGRQDLVDLFLDELYDKNTAKGIDEESIINDAIGNCKLFSFAGFETTSNLLVWTMVNLAIYPEWQDRAREEARQVLGNRTTVEPNDLSKFKVINMILYEVLRFYPPVFELTRIVEEDTRIGKYHFPKGVLIQLPVVMLHRNKEIWGPDADVFNPLRFSEGVMKATKGQAAFMPFGWGPRICLGQNFAIIESKVFMAMLLKTFTWELSPEYVHAPYAAFTLEAQHGAPLTLHQI